MPALPVVPNTLRVSFRLASTTVSAGSRLFFRYTGSPPGASTLNTFCGQVASAWGTNMAAVTHSTLSLVQVQAVDLNAANGSVGSDTSSHAGTAPSTTIMPANIAAVVNWGITRRYRGGKPRTYIVGGRDEDLADARSWTSTYASALAGAMQSWIQAIGNAPAISGGLQHVNVSYYSGFTSVQDPITHRYRNVPTLRPGGPQVDPVVAVTVRNIVGSQRRRLAAS